MGALGRLKGRCLCGAVELSAEPAGRMGACHCGMCRRFSGGVFLSGEVGKSLTIDKGADVLRIYLSSDWGERGFCGNCGASLFWRGREDGVSHVSIQVFDDPSVFAFEYEIFIDEKPSNYAFANDTHKMTGAEFVETVVPKPESAS